MWWCWMQFPTVHSFLFINSTVDLCTFHYLVILYNRHMYIPLLCCTVQWIYKHSILLCLNYISFLQCTMDIRHSIILFYCTMDLCTFHYFVILYNGYIYIPLLCSTVKWTYVHSVILLYCTLDICMYISLICSTVHGAYVHPVTLLKKTYTPLCCSTMR
jgi:hypothetical protein